MRIALLALIPFFAPASTLRHTTVTKSRLSSASRSRVVSYQNGNEDDGGNIDVDAMRPNADGDDDVGYGPLGTLVRQGPVALFHRVADPHQYELGVQKYMMIVGCSRKEAQGNLDAAIADPNSWVLNKLHAKNGKGYDPDYANANTSPRQIILTSTWGIAIMFILVKAAGGIPVYFAEHPHWQDYFTLMINGIPNMFP